MTRSKDERDRNRADLLRILEEQGTTPTGDLLAAAYGLKEVRPGLPPYGQGMADLRALQRQRKVMSTWLNGWLLAWALADQRVLDELEDAADVGRQLAGWEVAE